MAVGERPVVHNRKPPSKRLSKSKWQARKAKGLCFKCNEKFTISHQCKNRELRVLLLFDDEKQGDELGDEGDSQEDTGLEVVETIELSLSSMVGLTTLGTMKLKEVIKDTEVTILINCGVTHNFMGINLVKDLQLPLVTTISYGVVMGTRVAVKGKGICRGVVLTMQGLTIVQDFLLLDLGSTDVVLGMQWLGNLGSMEVNWKQLTMKFKMGNANMVLQGDPGLNKSKVSLKGHDEGD